MGSIPPRDLGYEVLQILIRFDIPVAYLNRLQQKYPGLTIRWHNMSINTQVISYDDIPRELFNDVTILCSQRLPDADWVPKCHFVQLTSAGPDKSIQRPLYQNPKVTLCTSNGVHPPQIAEWVIGAWLSFQHQFVKYAAQQQRCYWPSLRERATSYVEDSPGLRMGVLGYGAIGRQCARLAQALGMDVIAYTMRERKTQESRKDDSYSVPGTGDPDGRIPSAWYHGTSKDSITDFLAQDLDVLVMALPLTESTLHVIDEKQFDVMSKKKTFVINVGRGPHLKTDALILALETGKIRGAALDVTDPEPLPEDHPLWKATNLFITPHISWQTPHYFTRVLDILEKNLERLSKGEKLINQIDKTLHY